MRTVWKYRLNDGPITVPMAGRLVHVGFQDGQLTAWIEVETDETEAEERSFEVVGTGQLIPGHSVHRFTWIDGPFVWHLYQYEAGS